MSGEFTFDGMESNEIVYEADHINNFIKGFESMLSQYREYGSISEQTGFESYTQGVMRANGLQATPVSGFENFITKGLSKLWEMIKTFCKNVWNFFFGKNGSDNISVEEDTKTMKKDSDVVDKFNDAKTTEQALNVDSNLSTKEVAEVVVEVAKAIEDKKEVKMEPVPTGPINDVRKEAEVERIKAINEAKKIAAEKLKQSDIKHSQRMTAVEIERQMKLLDFEQAKKSIGLEKNILRENKAYQSMKKRLLPNVVKMVEFVNKNDNEKGDHLISSDFCAPGGSYWHTFKTSLEKDNVNIQALYDQTLFSTVLNSLEKYNKELENADKKLEKERLTDEQKQKILKNSYDMFQIYSKICADIKQMSKRLKTSLKGTIRKIDSAKAKIAAQAAYSLIKES